MLIQRRVLTSSFGVGKILDFIKKPAIAAMHGPHSLVQFIE